MKNKLFYILLGLILFSLMANVSAVGNETDFMQIDDGSGLKDADFMTVVGNDCDNSDLGSEELYDSVLDGSDALSDSDSSVLSDTVLDGSDALSGSGSDVLFDSADVLSDSQLDESNDSFMDLANENITSNKEKSILKKESTTFPSILDLDDIINGHNPLYGIVDFGSNTIHFEVYQLKKSGIIKSILDMSEVSVTAAYVEDNKLNQNGINRLLSYYGDFIDVMDFLDVKNRYFIATASLRKIDNYDEVVTALKEQLGIEITIIPGDYEAELSFNSVKDNDLSRDDGILIDLGGGSCEVIDFINKTPVTMESMPIGSFSTYDEYVSGLLPNETETEAIQNRVLEELSKLEVDNSTSRTDLFGVGGTVKAIKKVLRYLGYIDNDADSIPVSMLDSLLDEFKENKKETYYKILNINPQRVNTFVPGIIIIKTICNYFNVSELHFCKNGIREGFVMEIVDAQILKQDPLMNASDISVCPNEEFELEVGFEKNVTGEVVVELNNMIFHEEIVNGTALIKLPQLDCGNYTAKIGYTGDENYWSSSIKVNINVKNIVLTILNKTRGYNSNYDYLAKLTDDEGNPIVDKLVLFTVGGIDYYARTSSTGSAIIKPGLKVGSYNVTVSSPLLSGNATRTLKIVKRIQNNKNLNLYYNSNQKYKVKIIGNDGKAESKGKSVKVTINNRQFTYKTDANGFITITINKSFKAGTHTIKIQYMGDSVSNKVTVKHALSSQKLFNVKKSAKRIVIKAKLTLNNKNAIKNQKISFKFNGKTYTAKTNSNGIAQVSLSKSMFKRGTYAVSISYLRDTIKTSVKIL